MSAPAHSIPRAGSKPAPFFLITTQIPNPDHTPRGCISISVRIPDPTSGVRDDSVVTKGIVVTKGVVVTEVVPELVAELVAVELNEVDVVSLVVGVLLPDVVRVLVSVEDAVELRVELLDVVGVDDIVVVPVEVAVVVAVELFV